MLWSVRAAQAAACFDRIILSSDDPGALRLAEQAGITGWNRPPELAGDHASTLAVLQHVVERQVAETGVAVEYVTLLQPTSPLRPFDLIPSAFERLRGDAHATSLQTVFASRLFTGTIVDGYWRGNYPETMRSQDLPTYYVPSGVLYIYRYSATLAKNDAWGERVLPVIQQAGEVVNIDEEEDFQRLEFVYARDRNRYTHILPHG